MKRSSRRVCRIAMLTLVMGSTAALASAAPISPSRFEVTYTESGQMNVDVYGSYFDSVSQGSTDGDFFVAGDNWNPVVYGQPSTYGQFNGVSTFDNFVRYQYSSSAGNYDYMWNMPSVQSQDPAPSAVPEPGSMMLLGSGLLTLAGIARRRHARTKA